MALHKVSSIEDWRLIPNTNIIDTGIDFISLNNPKEAELLFKLLQDLACHHDTSNGIVFDLNKEQDDVLWIPSTKKDL